MGNLFIPLTIMAVIMRYIVWIAITSVSYAWEMKPLPPSPSVVSTTTTTTIRERSVFHDDEESLKKQSSETVVMRSRRAWIKEQSKLTLSSFCVLGGITASSIESSAAVSSSTTTDKNIIRPEASPVSSDENQHQQRPFSSAAFPKKEYTNSIVASRDTNISPLEVYETLQTQLKESSGRQQGSSPQQPRRALDVGAGAGVSTQVIYEQLGYTNIDALDWSGDAWRINVVENGYCPPTVSFYELDDERFLEQWKARGLDKYDVIAFNFAINEDKALYFSKNLLRRDGILLAPVNTQQDYWLKQTYKLIDSTGTTVWSANDVGAWSVQFQPDVTQPTCQGIWCSPFNGFQRLQRRPPSSSGAS